VFEYHDSATTDAFTYDIHTETWTTSPRLRRLHGLAPEELLTTGGLLERMHPDDRAEMLARFEEHLSRVGAYTCMYRMTDPDGREHLLRFVGRSVGGPDGVTGLEGFVLDLTDDISAWQSEAVTASAATRGVIEQAKGALMLAFGVGEEDAFRMLAGYSQHRNIKLRDVATFITAGIVDPQFFNTDQPVESLLEIVNRLTDTNAEIIPPVEDALTDTAPG
jgi:PAS domain S-box-containing protein